MATAPKPVTTETSDFSSALKTPSCRGYISTAPCVSEVRNGAAISIPGGTSSPKAWVAGSMATLMGSPAATARLARSAANCNPRRSCRARTEAASCGDSAATARRLNRSLPAAGCRPGGCATAPEAGQPRPQPPPSTPARNEGLRDFSQNLGAPVFLARNLGQAAGLEQAAQLSRQDGGFGGQVVVEEIGIGAVQKRPPRRSTSLPTTRGAAMMDRA